MPPNAGIRRTEPPATPHITTRYPATRALIRPLLLLSLLLPQASHPPCAHGGSYGSIAAELGRKALRLQKRRIAVLPFRNAVSQDAPSGLIISERLVSYLLSRGGLEVVERTLLETVMREQHLGSLGLLGPGSVRQLGRVLGVDAIVTGTVVDLANGRMEVNARMIDAESAQVLAVGTAKVDKDWSEPVLRDFSPWNVPVPPLPRFESDAPVLAVQWKDSPKGLYAGCRQAQELMGGRERSLVDVKARYWALRMRERDFSMASLTRNPGSEIQDPDTRRTFYSALQAWHGRPSVPALTEEELRALDEHETRRSRLEEGCQAATSLDGAY